MRLIPNPPGRPLCANGAAGGFTLVELVITMSVIGTVLLGLIAVQTRALVTTTDAKQRQQATAVGNQVMEMSQPLERSWRPTSWTVPPPRRSRSLKRPRQRRLTQSSPPQVTRAETFLSARVRRSRGV